MKPEIPDSRVLDALQTTDSIKNGEGPRGTFFRNYHTTCVASKAIGLTLGSSKKAMLVPVKVGPVTILSYLEALWLAGYDIAEKRRHRKAVVLMTSSVSIQSGLSILAIKLHMEIASKIGRDTIERLISHGIPIISSAGNYALWPNGHGQLRNITDMVPSIFARDTPLIAVGFLQRNGELHPTSQHSPLGTNAVGTDIECIDYFGHIITTSGSSYCKFT